MPAAANPGYLESSVCATLQGVINGKLYVGASQTYYGQRSVRHVWRSGAR